MPYSLTKLTRAEELVTGLSRVSWEKVDVSFHSSSLLRFAAHSVIQVASLPLSGCESVRSFYKQAKNMNISILS